MPHGRRALPRRALGVAVLLLLLLPGSANAADFPFAQLSGTGFGHSVSNASSVTISPDGEFAYATSPLANAANDGIFVYDRNPTTGALTPVPGPGGCVRHDGSGGCADGRGLNGVRATVISSDGLHLYSVGGTQDGTDQQGTVLA